jgi:hypothetical protein
MMQQNYEYGYYSVGDRRYLNKLQAVRDAVSIGHWIHWNFLEEEFSQYRWHQEPEQSLDYYYSSRARRIRETYNHVAVEFSGGADSWNLLYYFCKNQLPVDTVIHRYASEIVAGKYNLAPENQWAEGKYQAWPSFQYLRELDPGLKWVTREIVKPIIDGWNNANIDFEKQNNLHAGSVLKIHSALAFKEMGMPALPSTAVVYGVDKPVVELVDNKFYLVFYDSPLINRAVYDNQLLGSNYVSDILFYWSKDSIELLAKQAHLIVKYFRNNPDQIFLLDKKQSQKNKTQYLNTINKIIYPEFKPIWQTEKPVGLFAMTHESWFTQNQSIPGSAKWHEAMKNFSDVLKNTVAGTDFENFIHKDVNSDYLIMAACPSKRYYIGDLNQNNS